MFQKAWALFKAPFNKAIDSLQAKFPPNRIVALLTPIAFMPAAAWVSGYVAKHFPGLPVFTSGEVLGLMIAGALGALAAANKWLDGWQRHEGFVANDQVTIDELARRAKAERP